MFPYAAIAARHKERGDLLAFFKEVRHERKGLSGADIRGIAEAWGITVSEAYGIASFYSYLGTAKQGRNIVKLCMSTPCRQKGCGEIARRVQEELGISAGQTTQDGLFTLMPVNCIGQCDGAPAIQINDQVYPNMTSGKVRALLEQFSAEAKSDA